MNSSSLPTVTLTEHGTVALPLSGFVSERLDEATKTIPGRRDLRTGGWEWGFSREVLERLHRDLGLHLEATTAAYLSFLQGLPQPDPSQPTPVRGKVAVEWRSPTEGRDHQRRFKAWRRGDGLDHRLHHSALLEAGTGLGKTLMAIEEVLELLDHQPHARVLVLARNSLLRTVWGDQIEEHAAGLPYTILNGTRAHRLDTLATQDRHGGPHVFIHNHEDLPAMGSALAKLYWHMVVLDESSRFRTANAARVKLLTRPKGALRAETRLALSGQPVIKRTTDLYPTLKWLGAPTGNKQEFMDRFLVVDPDGRTELAIKDVDGLNRLLDSYRFVIPKGSVLRLPRSWHYDRVELRPWQRATYKRVQKDLRTRFVDATGKVTERAVANRLGELLRLAQVTSGFEAIDAEHFNWRDDNAKTEHLLNNRLPDFEGEQVILWAHYQAEVENLHRLTSSAGWRPVKFFGGHEGSQRQREQANYEANRAFIEGRANLLIANTGAAGAGLNFPSATTMIFYTRTYNTEDWMQALERNIRLTTDPGAVLNVVVLEAPDTVDQHVTRVLGDDLRRAEPITAVDVAYVLGLAA